MAKVDYQAILVKVSRAPKLKLEALKVAQATVKAEKNQLIQDFNNHVVTKELEQGSEGENISKTLPGLSSSHGGNLFSFIGFFEGDEPTKVIREALKQSIGILDKNALFSRFAKGNMIEMGFRVQLVDVEELSELLEYPDGYQSGPLLKDLEDGKIRGLNYYIYDEKFGTYENSRSGTGLEAKTKKGKLITIRDAETNKPIKYISQLLEDFGKRIRSGV